MEKISTIRNIDFVKFSRVEDIDRIEIEGFSFFKGFGIIDYHETFKAWLRKFPRPVFIGALNEKKLIGWVYIDEWREGVSKDGNSVYVLRAIETQPTQHGRRIGTKMVSLGLQQTIGYMITKPVSPKAEEFFKKVGFIDPKDMPNCPVNLSKHPGYLIMTPANKKKTIRKFNEMEWQNKPVFIEGTHKIEESYDWKDIVKNIEEVAAANNSLCVYYNEDHKKHHSNTTSPENPKRVLNIFSFLNDHLNLFEGPITHQKNFYKTKEEDVLRAHTKRYIDFVRSYSEKGGGFLGDDTYLNKYTYDIAFNAVGGAISAVMAVINKETDISFALIRPPGHHATSDKHGGFCIFNNTAIAARYLQQVAKKERILILDFDAHAANGTQDIFYSDPNVLLISLHQEPVKFYPNTGFFKQLGKGEAVGRNINIEMPRGSGNSEYKYVFDELVAPLIIDFNPDFAICCCGFDPYYRDSLTQLNLTAQGFYDIAKFITKYLQGRSAVVLEGGYHEYCDKLAYVFINGLLGRPLPYIETIDPLQISATNEEKIRKKLIETVRDMKMILDDYYRLKRG